MSDIVIQAEGLSKSYQIGALQRHNTLRDHMVHGVRRLFQSNGRNRAGSNTIWALKDVSFTVKRGEVIGIIGRNGAGKSTILKILSRITEPTSGRAKIRGRVGSLLEVGTGFHSELTGRENIYLNGAILGMTKAEIDRKFDAIVDFSEIAKFIDTPVKRHSSGMYMRLAFAVAAHLDTEIMLVDEVLAVGDASFQKKCLGKMGDVAKQGRTVLFVSHNMGAITGLCQRVYWIDGGLLHRDGSPEDVISEYLRTSSSHAGSRRWENGVARPGVEEFKIDEVSVRDDDGTVTSTLDVRKPFSIEIRYRIMSRLPYCRVGFVVETVHGMSVLEAYDLDDDRFAGPRDPGAYSVTCRIPGNLLNTGSYVLTLVAGMPNLKNLAKLEGILSFEIEDTGAIGSGMNLKRSGVIRPRLQWECRPDVP